MVCTENRYQSDEVSFQIIRLQILCTYAAVRLFSICNGEGYIDKSGVIESSVIDESNDATGGKSYTFGFSGNQSS